MRMHKSKQLVLIENLDPILCFRRPWFADPELKDLVRNLHQTKEPNGEGDDDADATSDTVATEQAEGRAMDDKRKTAREACNKQKAGKPAAIRDKDNAGRDPTTDCANP